MPRLSIIDRLSQKWFRFKKWARWTFGPKPKLAWDTDCPKCGSEVLLGTDTRIEGNTVIAATGFRCINCGSCPPAKGGATK